MRYRGVFLSGKRVAFSSHALCRLVEMGIPPHQIQLTLEHPDETFTSAKYPATLCYRRGDLSLPVGEAADGTLEVITALWATKDAWRRAYEAGTATEESGRGIRDDIRLREH